MTARVGPIELSKCALLCVDLQNEYRADGAYPVLGYEQILGAVAALQSAARTAGVPVIHVQAWVERHERSAHPLLEVEMAERYRSAAADSPGADFCLQTAPLDGEIIVRKRWPSAFKQTSMTKVLSERGVEHLMVLGVWTDSCVRATVLDAVIGGYRVWLVKDACGSATDTMHRASVLDLANRLYGGGIVTATAAVDALRGGKYHAWQCTRPIEFAYTLATLDGQYAAL